MMFHRYVKFLVRIIYFPILLNSQVDSMPLYPEEPAVALVVDEIADYIEDIWGKLIPILLQNKEDKSEYV